MRIWSQYQGNSLLIYKTGFGKFRGKKTVEKYPGFAPEVAEILRDNFPNLEAVNGFHYS